MKLADALRGVPERALAPYRAAAGQVDGPIPDLVAQLAEPERVARVVGQLPPDALLALRILWFHPAAGMAPWLFQAAFTRCGGGPGADRALHTLLQQAVLVPPLSAGGQYAIAEEMRPALLRIVTEQWLPASGFYLDPTQVQVPAHAADPCAVIGDFIRLLGTLRNGVRIRQQDGLPYQADRRQLDAAVDAGSLPAPPPTVFGRAPWEGHSPTVAPLLCAALAFDLVEVRDGAWRDGPRAAEWVGLPPEVQWRGLLQTWAALCGTGLHDPLAQGVFACLQPGVWCHPLALAQWLEHFAPSGQHRLMAMVQNVIVGVGVRLGALEWAEPRAGAPAGEGEEVPGCAVRLRPEAARLLRRETQDTGLPEFTDLPLVQGTFEILTGPRTAPALLWLLECWAERRMVDRFSTYRLTRRSVAAAIRQGGSVEALLHPLEATPGGVPQNVAFTTRDWANEVVHLQAEVALLVRCADEIAAARLERSGALRDCERLGPLAWQVPTDRVSAASPAPAVPADARAPSRDASNAARPRTRRNARSTLCISSGPPVRAAKTHPSWARHASRAASRSFACWARWRRKASRAPAGRANVRLPRSVFGAPSTIAPPTSTRLRRTVRVSSAGPMSPHCSPRASPCRRPV